MTMTLSFNSRMGGGGGGGGGGINYLITLVLSNLRHLVVSWIYHFILSNSSIFFPLVHDVIKQPFFLEDIRGSVNRPI